MNIVLYGISKSYGYSTIIKNVSISIDHSEHVAIAGANGSGKSTLMKIISGYLTPSNGHIIYKSRDRVLDRDSLYQYISFSAPYISTSELFTLREHFHFHCRFKPLCENISYKSFLDIIELVDTKDKYLMQFSSGMKQKVLVALAILSDSKLLLLDEPTSFLDEHAKQWFHHMMSTYSQNRTAIVASNDSSDFLSCSRVVRIEAGTFIF